ncbi:hypothetical protein QYB71_003041 [Clostridium perfringens]|nr:hypothetical protein [Clostridium perfringens]
MKYINTLKEDLTFIEAIQEFENGNVIRSYISECAYYKNRDTGDIYKTKIYFSDKEIKTFKLIKLDEEVWNSGEVQGKWNVLG